MLLLVAVCVVVVSVCVSRSLSSITERSNHRPNDDHSIHANANLVLSLLYLCLYSSSSGTFIAFIALLKINKRTTQCMPVCVSVCILRFSWSTYAHTQKLQCVCQSIDRPNHRLRAVVALHCSKAYFPCLVALRASITAN